MLTFMFRSTIYFELNFSVLSEIEVKVYCFLHGSQVITAQIIEKNFSLFPLDGFGSLSTITWSLSGFYSVALMYFFFCQLFVLTFQIYQNILPSIVHMTRNKPNV